MVLFGLFGLGGHFVRQLLGVITQQAQTAFGDIQNAVAAIGIVFRQALKVIINTGNDVSQGIQCGPVRYLPLGHQLLTNITSTGGNIGCSALQRNHRQTAAHTVEQVVNRLQLAVIPLIGNKGVDGFAGFFQRVARFLHHQLMNLSNVLRGSQALHVAIQAVGLIAALQPENALQAGFDVKHATGDVHQCGIRHGRLAANQTTDLINLLQQHTARLPQSKHRQRVGDTLHDRLQRLQAVELRAITAHKQVQLVLDLQQLFAQCQSDRLYGLAIGTNQAIAGGALLVGPGALELIAFFQRVQPGTAVGALGHVKQQVTQQLARRIALQRTGAARLELAQFLISLTQQLTHCRAIFNAAQLKTFSHTGKNRPQTRVRRALTQGFKPRKDVTQVTAVDGHILTTNHTRLSHLQSLTQLAQLQHVLLAAEVRQFGLAGRYVAVFQFRAKQRIFRQQLVAPGGAHVVEQRQQHHGQITPAGLHPVQVGRHLQDSLHEDFQRLALTADAAIHQGLSQLLHFLGQQRRAVELDHLQCAVHLMDVGQAKAKPSRVFRVIDKGFQRLSRLI